jgi:septal ring factor EnvC (AmiA/AmiB activator)
MTGLPTDANTTDAARAEHLARRRLEGEIFALQSDRSRFERQSNELDAEIRALERAVTEKEIELDERKSDRNRLISKIQDIDAEIIRVKRSSYKK